MTFHTVPVGAAFGVHLGVLEAIVVRLLVRTRIVQPLELRFTLARVGRELATAVRCQRDPEGLTASQWREMSHQMPWLACPPAPIVLADGRLL
jgi:hypothetical protein